MSSCQVLVYFYREIALCVCEREREREKLEVDRVMDDDVTEKKYVMC